jgi:hypothetical protein
MAKGQQRGNREAKKPKKEKIKVIAAAPSQKAGGWQPLGFRQKEIVASGEMPPPNSDSAISFVRR